MILQVEKLAFGYQKDFPILKEISFTMKKGEILCLLGANGTGKTTLMRNLLGLNQADKGKIFISNNDISALSADKRAKYLAYVPQSSNLAFSYKAWEVVMMGRVGYQKMGFSSNNRNMKVVHEAIERLGIEKLADKYFQQLSGGEKQMVLIARAIAQEAEVIIMDEPTSSLDFHNQVKTLEVIKSLANEDYTILMTSHQPDHAFLVSTKVALMKDGRIVAIGEPDDVVTGERLTKLYATPVSVAEATLDFGGKTKVCVPILENISNTIRMEK